MRLRQEPTTPMPVITNYENLAVFGNFPLLTVTPSAFVKAIAVLGAVQDAISYVATWPTSQVKLSVTNVSARLSTLESFPSIVRVDFQVVLGCTRDRQAFIRDVAMDGARKLAGNISLRVPTPYRNNCALPDIADIADIAPTTMLQTKEAALSDLSLRLETFGNLTITGLKNSLAVAERRVWQEAMAMTIAEVAGVSRLQVGLVMAVESGHALSVTFWLYPCIPGLCQAAIRQVEELQGALLGKMRFREVRWRTMNAWVEDVVVRGRIALQVPSPHLFVSSSIVKAAAEHAIKRVAVSPGPQASNLLVSEVNVTLAVLDTAMGARATNPVLIVFQVGFREARDGEVFAWDVAVNGGEQLIREISARVPAPFSGACSMPVQHQEQAIDPKLKQVAMTTYIKVNFAQALAAAPELLEAMAMAVADMALVPPSQVGVLALPGETRIGLRCWVASENSTFRQVAIAPLLAQAGREKGLRLMLTHFNRLRSRSLGWGPAELVNGSVALKVRNPRLFASDKAVQEAIRKTIAQAAAVPARQVQGVQVYAGLWKGHPEAVRINFQVAFNSSLAREAFTRNAALQGGARLANNISQELPMPFRGFCQLPEATQARASATAVPQQRGQPYGTILLSLFNPQLVVAHPLLQESVARAIAKLAAVPRPQVVVLLTAPSAAIMRIDFWVASTSNELREVAVQRVNSGWANSLFKRMLEPELIQNGGYASPAFVACGGTVTCCPTAGAPYKC